MCGVLVPHVYKTLAIEQVQRVLELQRPLLLHDPLHCVHANLCAAALEVGGADDLFHCCSCCHHWTCKRMAGARFLFPLQALKLHLQSMPFIEGKQLDTRVIFRLSVTLSRPNETPRNYMAGLFSESERRLFALIASGTVCDVTRRVAAAAYLDNASPLFMPNARLTEMVRQGEALDSLEELQGEHMDQSD